MRLSGGELAGALHGAAEVPHQPADANHRAHDAQDQAGHSHALTLLRATRGRDLFATDDTQNDGREAKRDPTAQA